MFEQPDSIDRNLQSSDPLPECIRAREQGAVYMWTSAKRLVLVKAGETVSLSGDDIRALIRFFNNSCIEDQL